MMKHANVDWKNDQWAITKHGIKCVGCDYLAERNSLGEVTDGTNGLPEWPLHMMEKNWVNDDLFLEAFVNALRIYEMKPSFCDGWRRRCARSCDSTAATKNSMPMRAQRDEKRRQEE